MVSRGFSQANSLVKRERLSSILKELALLEFKVWVQKARSDTIDLFR